MASRCIRPHSKMRTGCVECKRRRIKCDEKKPTCTRCRSRPDRCTYEFRLSWTEGRPFKNRENRTSAKSFTIPTGSRHLSPHFSHYSSAFADSQIPPPLEVTPLDVDVDLSLDLVINSLSPSGNLSETLADAIIESGIQSVSGTGIDEFGMHYQPSSGCRPGKMDDYQEDESVEYLVQGQVPDILRNPYPICSPLLSTPKSRFFLHHYVTQTSSVIFPLSFNANPLRENLLQSAMDTPHLLHAFLSCASSHYNRLHSDPSRRSSRDTTKLTTRALHGLQLAMNSPTEAFKIETISTALALCTSDIISGCLSSWRVHLLGANKLIDSAYQATETFPQTSTTAFIVKWFTLLNILAGVSGLRKGANHPRGHQPTYTADQSHPYIDGFMGCSLDLIPIMAQIGRMARVQRRQMQMISLWEDSEDEVIEREMQAEKMDHIRMVECQIYALYNRTSDPSLKHDPATRCMANEMEHVHRIFLHTVLLHLYRRVQGFAISHPKVAHAIHMIIETLQLVRINSTANILILWPVFTAGCETPDPVQRHIIEERMLHMEVFGMGNVHSARRVMNEYWGSGCTERWDVFLENNGQDIVLF